MKKNLILILLMTLNLWGLSVVPITNRIKNLDLTNINKLMIVAHPDDEMIWGGSRLIEDDYLVVCITCGTNHERVNEFITVMNETKDTYLMLGYPDKINGKRSDWKNSKESIATSLEEIYNLKDWELIVTHNPEGEYGHIHHIMTNQIVTAFAAKDHLYYFGKYYSRNQMTSLKPNMNQISRKTLTRKKEILKHYVSQSFIDEKFGQMYPYEEWLTYDEWQVLHNDND